MSPLYLASATWPLASAPAGPLSSPCVPPSACAAAASQQPLPLSLAYSALSYSADVPRLSPHAPAKAAPQLDPEDMTLYDATDQRYAVRPAPLVSPSLPSTRSSLRLQ